MIKKKPTVAPDECRLRCCALISCAGESSASLGGITCQTPGEFQEKYIKGCTSTAKIGKQWPKTWKNCQTSYDCSHSWGPGRALISSTGSCVCADAYKYSFALAQKQVLLDLESRNRFCCRPTFKGPVVGSQGCMSLQARALAPLQRSPNRFHRGRSWLA